MTSELQEIAVKTVMEPGKPERPVGSPAGCSPGCARPLSITGYGHALAFAVANISGRRVFPGYHPLAGTATPLAVSFSGKDPRHAATAEINRTKGFTAG